MITFWSLTVRCSDRTDHVVNDVLKFMDESDNSFHTFTDLQEFTKNRLLYYL